MPSEAVRSSTEQQTALLGSTSSSFEIDGLDVNVPLQKREFRVPVHSRPWKERLWALAAPWLRPRYAIVTLIILSTLVLISFLLPPGPRPRHLPPHKPFAQHKWEKPKGFKIIGLVFFGRPPTVAILDCYLKANLVENGGWLDEVHWVINTPIEDDLLYLHSLVRTSDKYKQIEIPPGGYNSAWEHGVTRENMYIKIDDDIVSPIPRGPCWKIY